MRKTNILKNIFILIISLCLGMASLSTIASSDKESIVINGSTIKYRTTGEVVQINKQHDPTGGEFRGVWVSALTSDISGYTTEEAYKKQMIDVLENMEVYNLNVMIFHVRMMNDACYESKYNSWSSYYNTNPDKDMLPWLIEECHKRGIEFHAWMNPYRVTTNVAQSLEECAKKYKSTNAASKAKNLLKASSCIILNPGEPEVRDFLVNTCMELVENYDVDAIHFDDYFYAAGIDDSETVRKYNTNNLSIDDFRRLQVDLFIEDLHNKLTDFNNQNGRRVQLGIAPTGVYRNGNGQVTYDADGNAITTGSKTSAYAHFGSPLYADTLKWINNGWIDYMLPQTYWAITNSAGPYCDLVKWWNDACAKKKTNLYSSLGLYMSIGGGNASWGYNKKEGYQQIMFANSLEHVRGSSIYNYLSLVSSLTGDSMMQGVKGIWNKAIYLPEIRTVDGITPNKVENFEVSKTKYGNKLSFSNDTKAKFFVLYRSENPITFDESEIIDVIGSSDDLVEYTDSYALDNKQYYYGIKAQSHSLTLGEGVTVSTDNIKTTPAMSLGKLQNVILSDNLVENETLKLQFDNLYYPYGTTVQYKVNYEVENIDGSKQTFENVSIQYSSSKNIVKINVPKGTVKLKAELLAYNNCGESSVVIERDISKSLGKIGPLLIKGSTYATQEVDVVFNNLLIEGTKYIIQASLNGIEFNDCQEIQQVDSNITIRTKFELSNDNGKVYYRIKAINDSSFAYSDVCEVNQISYLGDVENIKINNKDSFNVRVSEDDNLSISWDKINDDISYICYFSTDQTSWVSAKVYDSGTILENQGSKCLQNIEVNYKYFKFYLKVVGKSNDGETESEVITVEVQLQDLFSDEVSDYIIKNNTSLINEMDIFNK